MHALNFSWEGLIFSTYYEDYGICDGADISSTNNFRFFNKNSRAKLINLTL